MATTASLADLAEQELAGFRGELIGPGHSGYEEARAVYNAMIDRRPGLIARCASADDVAATINFARRHDVLVAVRGGGHNGGGLGTVDDGVAGAVEDERPLPGGLVGELAHEPALARPRLAAQERDPAPLAPGPRHQGAQERQLAGPADEGEGRRQAQRAGELGCRIERRHSQI